MPQHLIYVMDPMCSWCWGFAPVVDAIEQAFPELPLQLVAGGLRAGVTDPMQDKAREAMAEHWRAVKATTGQPVLTPDALPANFIYNTEPACRALVAARELDTQKTWALVKAIQRAFYTQAQDVTCCSVLFDLAEQVGYPRKAFSKTFLRDDTRSTVKADFTWARDLGISGFPTLLAKRNGMLSLLTNGYQPSEVILPLLERWVRTGKEFAGQQQS